MSIIQRLRAKTHNLLLQNYPIIIVASFISIVTASFFHFHLKYHGRDLLYWKGLIRQLQNEYEYLFVYVVIGIIGLKVLIAIFMLFLNYGTMEFFEDLQRIEARKRYSDYLFIRLVSDINRIYERELSDKCRISLDTFTRVQEETEDKIAKFRRDARKVMTPDQMDVSVPPEEVYYEDEETDKRFSNVKLSRKSLEALVNPS